ncbi:hypothetical protein HELRODRAFT_165163 [Helobdella robusta]|uniref:RNase H type-1 domain-containing protein n=1 Tax=Helobdella robusta TaxID=6412 RepID=T1EWC9_HELRO|nr:hypothetical protein HELRODRAFT_165163 [Helobdella robusta]ESN93008.1 hypothetical protein HELRODRAFT_165163 [Helobdella robusta]
MAINFISKSNNKNFIIFSDSLSTVTALKQYRPPHNLIIQTQNRIHDNLYDNNGKKITLIWIPSHIEIQGNEEVDQLASQAHNIPISNLPIPHNDLRFWTKSNLIWVCYQRKKHSSREAAPSDATQILPDDEAKKVPKKVIIDVTGRAKKLHARDEKTLKNEKKSLLGSDKNVGSHKNTVVGSRKSLFGEMFKETNEHSKNDKTAHPNQKVIKSFSIDILKGKLAEKKDGKKKPEEKQNKKKDVQKMKPTQEKQNKKKDVQRMKPTQGILKITESKPKEKNKIIPSIQQLPKIPSSVKSAIANKEGKEEEEEENEEEEKGDESSGVKE